MIKKFLFLTLISFILVSPAWADFEDNNGDGEIRVLAFGDSITYGIGSNGIGEEKYTNVKGYPYYLAEKTGVEVVNGGVPGEILTSEGVNRLIPLLKSGQYDAVLIMEGANDAAVQVPADDVSITLQKLINIAILNRVEPILLTLPQTSGEHGGLRPWLYSYNVRIAQLAYINSLRLVDLEVLWSEHGCTIDECDLYNMPEGLHPNSTGYQFIADNIYNVIYGVSDGEDK